jgi:hypothetical protein
MWAALPLAAKEKACQKARRNPKKKKKKKKKGGVLFS